MYPAAASYNESSLLAVRIHSQVKGVSFYPTLTFPLPAKWKFKLIHTHPLCLSAGSSSSQSCFNHCIRGYNTAFALRGLPAPSFATSFKQRHDSAMRKWQQATASRSNEDNRNKDNVIMSDDSSPSRTRRSSFAGQTLADIFGSRQRPSETGSSPPSSYPGPITSAAVQAQRRRLSLTTLGLSTSNTQAGPFARGRNDSLGSGSGSIDECAVEDDAKDSSATPSTPFARRVSFGARAMMDIRNSNGQSQTNGRSPPSNPSSSVGRSGSNRGSISARDTKGRGVSFVTVPSSSFSHCPQAELTLFAEGFNWSENLRNRAERSSNVGLPGSTTPTGTSPHQRAKSVAVMEPPILETPKEQKRPDHFQERILKGDFYMD